ncbi:unnamed protein product [Ectocarpus sp. 6 AP-2014]
MGFLGILLFFGTASLTFTSAVDNDSLFRDLADDGREIIKVSNALSAGLRGPEANGLPLEQSWSRSLKNKRSHLGINHGGKGGGGGDRGDRGRSNRDARGRRGNGNGGGRDRAGGGRRGDRGRARGDRRGDGQSAFTCEDGILEDGYCCSKTCGVGGCGGVGCRRRNGLRTADDCCFSRITDLCSVTGCAPCKMDDDAELPTLARDNERQYRGGDRIGGGRRGDRAGGGGRRGDRDGGARGDRRGDGQSAFTCEDGILEDGYCCSKTCGVGGCGGVGCRRRNGLRTADDCCFSRITDLCSVTGCAPCKMDDDAGPTPTPSPAPSPTPSPTPSPAPSPTRSPTLSPTPSPTLSPTPSPTPFPTPSPTRPPTPSPTPSPTLLPTPSTTPSPTQSPMPPIQEEQQGACCESGSKHFRVAVDNLTQDEVFKQGPITIFASCNAAWFEGYDAAQMLLSVQVQPYAESDTEYVMVSWADEIETATHAAPFSTLPLATTRPDEYTWTDVGPHSGIISIATASGHSVSFDGAGMMNTVVSREDEPAWEFASQINPPTDDFITKRCVIIGTLNVHGTSIN